MRNLDFSSWQSLLSTLIGLAVITLIMVGIRLLVMQTVQQRRERENRQINERLRTLIAAYKVLGGSFTGDLAVDPAHLRDLRRGSDEFASREATMGDVTTAVTIAPAEIGSPSSDRSRRIRDSVEAALSDIVLLGTQEQVRLAAKAASELAAGRPVHTAELVVSLRDFIRQVLDLDAIPPSVSIPRQGPARPSSARGSSSGGKAEGGGQGSGKQAGGGGGGMGIGVGLGSSATHDDIDAQR
jgi:hypothetical protein